MALLEDITLTDSIEIRTTPEKVFSFITNLVDDNSYRVWHPDDHVSLRWIRGRPWEEGSVACAEEYLHGRLHRMRFTVTRVVPNAEIHSAPASRFLRRYFPGNAFYMEKRGDRCIFTATGTLRVGWLIKTFARKKLDYGLSSVRQHMKEEGENLKKILERCGNSRTAGTDDESTPHDN